MIKNPVVHFEMPGEDMERMKKFYETAFGWETQQMGKEYGDYVVVMTSDSDKAGPLEKGRINGGFYKKPASGYVSPSFVIAVEDIRQAMKDVVAAGGKIRGSSKGMEEPDEIPGVGLFMSAEDSEGNRIGLMQPTGMQY